MKLILALAALIPAAAHAHSAKHGMLLFGDPTVYASHLVNRDPHHFQVILKVGLGASAKAAYLKARADYPEENVVLVLDEMELADLEHGTPALSGTLVRVAADGARTPFHSGVQLMPWDYERLFFQELPLDLSGHRGGPITCWEHSDCPANMFCQGGSAWASRPGFCQKASGC
jgi:hypothetical protein